MIFHKDSYVETFITLLDDQSKEKIYGDLLHKSDLTDEEVEIMWQLSQDMHIQAKLSAAFVKRNDA